MKIALAQINPTIGAFEENYQKICKYITQAKENGAEAVIFPELATCGYPPRDLLCIQEFVKKNEELVSRLASSPLLEGVFCVLGTVFFHQRQIYNGAVLISQNKVEILHKKVLLPSYDVFDEVRYFEEGKELLLSRWGDREVAVVICEDIWWEYFEKNGKIGRKYPWNPLSALEGKKVDILIQISASPYEVGKEKIRHRLLGRLAERLRLTAISLNQVGGQDDLLFDGGSFVCNKGGKVVQAAARFREDLLLVDIDNLPDGPVVWQGCREEEILEALVMGTRDYVRKCGFEKVLLGLSGGIDSALVAVIATLALGKENVWALLMPSMYSSSESLEDAQNLVDQLGIRSSIFPIEDIYRTYRKNFQGVFGNLPFGLAEENLQARIRGQVLMWLSNKFNHLVLATGNKSELAVGYCTLYGDMCGALAVIGDVFKTEVYKLSRYVSRRYGWIPHRILTKPPSAELRPDQKDSDTLPPYEILDAILGLYIEESWDLDRIAQRGEESGQYSRALVSRVIQMVDKNEYKRKMAPLVLKITSKAFGIGRRMPVAQRYHW
ncbi:MAG: NAD+ synthase [Planctomycetota bacterium]|nr:MAG: NAD+ synthase [Planctomycetota bacterium]